MKTRTLKLTAIMLITLFLVISCDSPEIPPNFPKEISFTEFSLIETACEWKIPWELLDDNSEKVIIINSQQELRNFIVCDNYPVIDFSTHSLLLVYGLFRNDIINASAVQLQQISANDYLLNIDIIFGFNRSADNWITALLVPKISNEANIVLDVQHSQQVYEKIIGKWMLVEGVFMGEPLEVVPDYIVFFPNGRLRRFSYERQVYSYWSYELTCTIRASGWFTPWQTSPFIWELSNTGAGLRHIYFISEDEKVSRPPFHGSPGGVFWVYLYRRKQ